MKGDYLFVDGQRTQCKYEILPNDVLRLCNEGDLWSAVRSDCKLLSKAGFNYMVFLVFFKASESEKRRGENKMSKKLKVKCN